MRKDLVKERILLAISAVFLLINLVINYFPIDNSKIILLIVLAWLPIIFLNYGNRTRYYDQRKIKD